MRTVFISVSPFVCPVVSGRKSVKASAHFIHVTIERATVEHAPGKSPERPNLLPRLAESQTQLHRHRTRGHGPYASNVADDLPAQPVAATQALNLSAGVSYFEVSRGSSWSSRPGLSEFLCEAVSVMRTKRLPAIFDTSPRDDDEAPTPCCLGEAARIIARRARPVRNTGAATRRCVRMTGGCNLCTRGVRWTVAGGPRPLKNARR